MIKNKLVVTLILFTSIVFGQEEQNLEVFKTDSTWIKEIIKFPIGFAQDIKYEGFEDLRFPPGWSKEDSPNFWSYVWAWSINNTEEPTIDELEQNIQYYFDGLLGLDFYKIDDKLLHKTNALFIKKANSKDNVKYIGKVKTFDTRYTKKPMTLYVQIENYHCKKKNNRIVLFRFSPKPFKDSVWDKLKEVKLRKDVCEF